MRIKRPKPGDCVVVWWLDSGAGETNPPLAKIPCQLHVKETHGRVLSLGIVEDNNGKGRDTLLLVMCSAGVDDTGSDITAVWWKSVQQIENFGDLKYE